MFLKQNDKLLQTTHTYNWKLIFWLIIIHRIAYFLFTSMSYFQNHRRKLSGFMSMLMPKLRKNIVCPTIFDFKLCLNQSGGHWIYYLGFYELGTLDIITNCLKRGDTFFDVGSSIGLMTMVASKVVGAEGKVYSFEPDETRFQNLLNSIAFNGSKNVIPFNIALASRDSEIYLASDLPTPRVSQTSFPNSKVIRSRRIDSFIREENIKDIAFLKIDVEGFELEVLKGAKELLSEEKAPILCIECNTLLTSVTEEAIYTMIQFIQSCNSNYLFFQLEKTSHVVSNLRRVHILSELNTKDNLYCLTISKLSQVRAGRAFGEIDDQSSTLLLPFK